MLNFSIFMFISFLKESFPHNQMQFLGNMGNHLLKKKIIIMSLSIWEYCIIISVIIFTAEKSKWSQQCMPFMKTVNHMKHINYCMMFGKISM